jgi:hypothetical protein
MLDAPALPTRVFERPKPLRPFVFAVGAGLTAAGITATILSGIDTRNDPGPDQVRRECVGLGDSCPAYQRGLDSQLRTNLLLAGTVAVGLATGVVGLFLTDWSSRPRKAAVRPAIGVLSGGAHLGLTGEL